MKPFSLLTGTLTLSLALLAGVQAQDILTNGLVAYYPFNGNVNDASGNGNNGTLHGTDWNYSFDRFGDANSLYLNITSTPVLNLDAYVTAPRSQLLDFSKDFTLSVWVNLKSVSLPDFAQNLISNGDDQTNVNLRVLTGYIFAGGSDDLEFVWHTLGQVDHVSALLPPVRETWWQTTVVRSGTNVSLYRNGSSLANAMMTPVSNSSEIRFGRERDFYPLIGGIDDVRMYNRALSLAEVQQLYVKESTCIPHFATATATMVNGFVVAINITGQGCGYTNAPLVEIHGGGGSGATATATVTNGNVTGITITDAGIGYTNTPAVSIASPPFVPWLGIAVSKVKVTQHIVLGRNYVLESSTDLITWTQVGVSFTAHDESITLEFDVDVVGRFFRIREVQ